MTLGWRKAHNYLIYLEKRPSHYNEANTEILKSAAGYHIITVIDKRGAQQMLIKQRHVRHHFN